MRALVVASETVKIWEVLKGQREGDGVRATWPSSADAQAFADSMIAEWQQAGFGPPRAIAPFDELSETQVVSLARDIVKHHKSLMGTGGLPATCDAMFGDDAAWLATLARLVDTGFAWDPRRLTTFREQQAAQKSQA